jgi:hypothetical protein
VRRQADVAVVEAHDVEAVRRELLAERVLEVDALAPEAVDQQQRLVAGIAEGLEIQLDGSVVGSRHGGIIPDFMSECSLTILALCQ